MFLHSDLPSNPTPANFEKLKNAPDNASVRSFVAATQKLSSDLQVSKDEAKKFSAGDCEAEVARYLPRSRRSGQMF